MSCAGCHCPVVICCCCLCFLLDRYCCWILALRLGALDFVCQPVVVLFGMLPARCRQCWCWLSSSTQKHEPVRLVHNGGDDRYDAVLLCSACSILQLGQDRQVCLLSSLPPWLSITPARTFVCGPGLRTFLGPETLKGAGGIYPAAGELCRYLGFLP